MNESKQESKSSEQTNSEYPVIPLVIPNNYTYDAQSKTMSIDPNKQRDGLVLNKPCIEFIRSISSKIATISIIGRARTGKSLVAGELYAPNHIPCPFDLGHQMDACTYGVWVSAKPIKHPHEKDTVILIFDCEGTGYHQAKKQHDMQLMVITLLISSYFIYNTIGTFNSDALDELEFVTELTDCIKVKPNDEDGNGLEYILPKFMWLLRDSKLYALPGQCAASIATQLTDAVNDEYKYNVTDLVRTKLMDSMTFIVNSTSWDSIDIFNKTNPTETTALIINKSDLIANIKRFCTENMNNINLLPINVCNEFIWIVKIFEGVTVGISLQYNPENKNIKVMDIYLDKKQIENQLVKSHGSIRCLDNFESNINMLIINNDINKCFGAWENDELASTDSETDWEAWEHTETDSEMDEKLDDIHYKESNIFYY